MQDYLNATKERTAEAGLTTAIIGSSPVEYVIERSHGLDIVKTFYRATRDEVLILLKHYAWAALEIEYLCVLSECDTSEAPDYLFPRRRVEDLEQVVGQAAVDSALREVWDKLRKAEAPAEWQVFVKEAAQREVFQWELWRRVHPVCEGQSTRGIDRDLPGPSARGRHRPWTGGTH